MDTNLEKPTREDFFNRIRTGVEIKKRPVIRTFEYIESNPHLSTVPVRYTTREEVEKNREDPDKVTVEIENLTKLFFKSNEEAFYNLIRSNRIMKLLFSRFDMIPDKTFEESYQLTIDVIIAELITFREECLKNTESSSSESSYRYMRRFIFELIYKFTSAINTINLMYFQPADAVDTDKLAEDLERIIFPQVRSASAANSAKYVVDYIKQAANIPDDFDLESLRLQDQEKIVETTQPPEARDPFPILRELAGNSAEIDLYELLNSYQEVLQELVLEAYTSMTDENQMSEEESSFIQDLIEEIIRFLEHDSDLFELELMNIRDDVNRQHSAYEDVEDPENPVGPKIVVLDRISNILIRGNILERRKLVAKFLLYKFGLTPQSYDYGENYNRRLELVFSSLDPRRNRRPLLC